MNKLMPAEMTLVAFRRCRRSWKSACLASGGGVGIGAEDRTVQFAVELNLMNSTLPLSMRLPPARLEPVPWERVVPPLETNQSLLKT